jgi:hypothetical protein
VGAQLDQGRQLIELAALNALRDPDQILRDYPAGPEVEVPHLAVPHLTFRQPDGQAAGLQQRPRVRLPQPMPDRCGGQLDGVAVALLPVPPAVQDDQDDPVRVWGAAV